jgi:hypothetical protein
MNQHQQRIEKQNSQMPQAMRAVMNPFDYSQDDLYRLMYEAGQRRFGSVCRHEEGNEMANLDYVLIRENSGNRWYKTGDGESNNVRQAKTFTTWEAAARAAEGTRYKYCQVKDLMESRYEIRYSKGGFGESYKPFSKRPYAIRDTFAATWIRTRGGPIRTFGSKAAAAAAIEQLMTAA